RLRDRRLDGELAAVGAQRPERGDVPHAAARDAGRAEAPDVVAVRAAEALRDEAIERPADRLFAAHAEYLFRGAIEKHDVLLLVDRDHGVHRRIDDRREARLRGIERAFHALGIGRDLLRFGDVARHLGRADDAAVAVADRGHAERDVQPAPVLRAPHRLEMRYRLAPPGPGDGAGFPGRPRPRHDPGAVA